MNDQILRKQLLYRSTHRGCKEMDILLGNFAEAELDQLHISDLKDYKKLLEANDVDIYNWICQRQAIPQEYRSTVLLRIIEFNKIGKYVA